MFVAPGLRLRCVLERRRLTPSGCLFTIDTFSDLSTHVRKEGRDRYELRTTRVETQIWRQGDLGSQSPVDTDGGGGRNPVCKFRLWTGSLPRWLRDTVLSNDPESGNGSDQASVHAYGVEDHSTGSHHFRDARLSEGGSVLHRAHGMETTKR